MPAQFSGDPETLWIANAKDNDRKMKVIKPFWFEDRSGDKWETPADYVVDGASIPRALWTLIGSPYTGQYRRASVVHDKACDVAKGDKKKRRAADRMFFEACREGGCDWFQAMILYAGVRIGSIWSDAIATSLWDAMESDGPTLVRPPHEDVMVREFQFLGNQITLLGETDDPIEVEKRTDAGEAMLMQIRAATLRMSTVSPGQA